MRRVSLVTSVFVGCVAIFAAGAAFADIATEWDFNGNLNATFGSGTMSYFNTTGTDTFASRLGTVPVVQFGTAGVGNAFNASTNPIGAWDPDTLPNNASKKVMFANAFTPTQGLLVKPNAPANGTGTESTITR